MSTSAEDQPLQPHEDNSSSTKPRRFAVEPIETSSRSSKDSVIAKGEESKPQRRFAPIPVETSTRSSKDAPQTEESAIPRRRFAPQPIETTTRSSKDTSQAEEPIKPRRRFAPEPVETTTRSSKDTQQAAESNAPRRRFAPDPIETTSRSSRDAPAQAYPAPKPRRWATPAPIDFDDYSMIGADSNRDSIRPMIDFSMIGADSNRDAIRPIVSKPNTPATPMRRKFAPEPVETTRYSNRSSPTSATPSSSGTSMSMESAPLLPHERALFGRAPAAPPALPPRRKFAPQLIETARRSRRSNSLPTLSENDKTDASPRASSTARRPDGESKLLSNQNNAMPTLLSTAQRQMASQQEGSSIGRSRSTTRKHSYRVPRLESIESSESDESPPPPSLFRSRSTRGSGHTRGSDTSEELLKQAGQGREEKSPYMLALEAELAEQQLLEQASAAYPNADRHEPVAHYVDDSGDEEEEEAQPTETFRNDPTRRDSGDDKLAYQEMRLLAEKRMGIAPQTQTKPKDPWQSNLTPMQAALQQYDLSHDMRRMLEASRPPMLGDDIHFIRCASPEHARFDVTQGADFLKQQMCYLSQEQPTHTVDEHGLWAKRFSVEQETSSVQAVKMISGLWGQANKSKDDSAAGGLWGGSGIHSAKINTPGLTTPMRTPLATPSIERDDPFASAVPVSPNPNLSVNNASANAPSLPSQRTLGSTLKVYSGQWSPQSKTNSATASPKLATFSSSPASTTPFLNQRLELEARLDAEFNDTFITQVYNYLSLGYPALAWKFDEELSRVTRVPVDELRMDDNLTGPHGHIRLEDDEVDIFVKSRGQEETKSGDAVQSKRTAKYQAKEEGVVEETMCRRWRALRKYVREWGRQMLKNGDDKAPVDIHEVWGSMPGSMMPRRGSWGI